MTDDLQIIKATLSHLEILESISKQSFVETYADKNTEENIANYLTENFDSEPLIRQLNNSLSEFYLAYINNSVVGYLKINSGNAQTEQQNDNAIEIERIYVLKEFQGKRIGQLLCNKAFQIGQQKKAEYLWLGVWEENFKAIRFYKKYGFIEFDRHMFKLGVDEQQDIMMKLNL